jgi:sugar phosphate isomerase/epimerase
VSTPLSRREWLAAGTVGVGISLTGLGSPTAAATQDRKTADPFTYCLNTSTIRGQNIPIAQEVEIAAKAGYQGIEPWMRELEQYVKDGGNLKDLGKRIRDQGLKVESAIGFAEWIVDEPDRRKKGLEQARRDMEMLLQIGGMRIAAPPAGATKQSGLDLLQAAERYRALMEVGDQIGVIPQVEVWGFSRTLSRLGETTLVAMESGHAKACILPDVYHLHKGGTDFNALRLLSGAAMHVFHMNDYPANPGRAEITDAHRVYPGDGVAPLARILRDLRAVGFQGVLSLELFNKEYWKQDALTVARTGLEKMRAAVRASFA